MAVLFCWVRMQAGAQSRLSVTSGHRVASASDEGQRSLTEGSCGIDLWKRASVCPLANRGRQLSDGQRERRVCGEIELRPRFFPDAPCKLWSWRSPAPGPFSVDQRVEFVFFSGGRQALCFSLALVLRALRSSDCISSRYTRLHANGYPRLGRFYLMQQICGSLEN
jgi:hypothetical protein